MNRKVIHAVMKELRIDEGENNMLLVLGAKCPSGSNRCTVTLPELIQAAKMSRSGVQAVVKRLKDKGLLAIEREGLGRGAVNTYVLSGSLSG